MKKMVAGTVLLFSKEGQPHFLVKHHNGKEEFIATPVEEEATNLGSILNELERQQINIEKIDLIDLVTVSTHQGSMPLYVFGELEDHQLAPVHSPMTWMESSQVQSLLGEVDLSDVPLFK